MFRPIGLSIIATLFSCLMAALVLTTPSTAQEDYDMTPPSFSIIYPNIDPLRGKEIFVEKNCVLCHAVNGIGGDIAPPLDAPDNRREVDLLDFAARMWRGSYAMVELQATELDYQIDLEGYEIGDIAAFAYDLETQKSFTEDDVPAETQQRILDLSIAVEDGLFD